MYCILGKALAAIGIASMPSLAEAAVAPEFADISNYRAYSDTFASSGQPSKQQLEALRDNGFERIVYIAFTDSPDAIANEDKLVLELGMDYLHIPVEFSKPTANDFYAFADAMQREPGKKTLLHCQVNFRASAFSFLYRVIYEDVAVEKAKADLNTVWQPDETWRDFIFAMLEANDKSAACDGCDWSIEKE